MPLTHNIYLGKAEFDDFYKVLNIWWPTEQPYFVWTTDAVVLKLPRADMYGCGIFARSDDLWIFMNNSAVCVQILD